MGATIVGLCKICRNKAQPFDVVDFAKTCSIPNVYPMGLTGVPVYYSRCGACGFIFTEHFDCYTAEDWASKIYNEDYRKVDPDYLDARPRSNATFLKCFLAGRKHATLGLDFGGGNGLTAALLRAEGWAFDAWDPYGASAIADASKGKYNVITAFEVLEHLPDPVSSLSTLLSLATDGPLVILLSTGTTDGKTNHRDRLSWWYAAPRNGHISLFSTKALRELAGQCGLDFVCSVAGFHLMTRHSSSAPATARLLLSASAMRFISILPRLRQGSRQF